MEGDKDFSDELLLALVCISILSGLPWLLEFKEMIFAGESLRIERFSPNVSLILKSYALLLIFAGFFERSVALGDPVLAEAELAELEAVTATLEVNDTLTDDEDTEVDLLRSFTEFLFNPLFINLLSEKDKKIVSKLVKDPIL